METLLIKLSGEIFTEDHRALIDDIITQIAMLRTMFGIGIVVGGGNFFRGARHGAQLGISRYTADTIGMLATVMNGLILRDHLVASGIPCKLLSAHSIHGTVEEVSKSAIDDALRNNLVIIFTGGTGLSHCSTDTAAITRALQIEASTVLKATHVDGIYDADPVIHSHAQLIKNISYKEAVARNLRVMDLTAMTWAQEDNLIIKVFNIFEHQALIRAIQDNNFGSTLHP